MLAYISWSCVIMPMPRGCQAAHLDTTFFRKIGFDSKQSLRRYPGTMIMGVRIERANTETRSRMGFGDVALGFDSGLLEVPGCSGVSRMVTYCIRSSHDTTSRYLVPSAILL